MGAYSRKLERYKKEWREKYDSLPETERFGNTELLSIQRNIENIERDLENHEECSQCDGDGWTECDECGHERDCEYCEAGLIEK